MHALVLVASSVFPVYLDVETCMQVNLVRIQDATCLWLYA